MTTLEFQNVDEVRRYVLQGLWLGRVTRPEAARVGPLLAWLMELAAAGEPLPPPGFVADLGQIAFGIDPSAAAKEHPVLPNWPTALGRNYEDHVLGKVYADWTFERAADALRRYEGKDRARGLAFVVKQFRERAGVGGVDLSPAIVRTMLSTKPDDLLSEGYESFTRDGPHPFLVRQYEELISAVRRMAEVLAPEDVIALEQRTAIADMTRFVAHRQILTLTAEIESKLPSRPVRPLVGRKEVPTRVLDEDQYPVGGYTSISNRGSVESLLHSQLAFMEKDESPDLFDMKFVRDELFYYSRDENQFLRRRRAFAFVLTADLIAARFKDAELPAQRIMLASATILALVRKLSEWLSTDALHFELLFVGDEGKQPLAEEAELFRILLRERIANKTAAVEVVESLAAVGTHCSHLSRKAQVQILQLTADVPMAEPDGTVLTALVIDTARPRLLDGIGRAVPLEAEDAAEAWGRVVRKVLELWV
ncbi:hypothetical protein [Limnoglobus roseus]|uniref:Uncharacterized protein n=1 Tax=Limnoglobus roseus TaxID=2598579 RepID=A0A5C1ADP9_9BACT|nr:hypothetical protein [Limnoglobus roseus]QEL17361.1 hypothetical protein PX52LOC_04345 [Limnoglobus roseus]